jgi:hypothetical protein
LCRVVQAVSSFPALHAPEEPLVYEAEGIRFTVTRDGKEIFAGSREVRILPSAKPATKDGVKQRDGK